MLRIGRLILRCAALMVLAGLLLGGLASPPARANTGEFDTLATRAASFLYKEFVEKGAQNSEFGVGAYAAYVLTRAGVDVSAWVRDGSNLGQMVSQMIEADLQASTQDPRSVSAKQLAQDLVAAQALGWEDRVQRLCQALQNKEGPHGLDTGDYALPSNLAAYDLLARAACVDQFVYARDYILSTQNLSVADAAYGSWGYVYQGQYYPDFMATAQAVRALAALDANQAKQEVKNRIALALEWLMAQQKPDGSFALGWDDPLIDTVEMLATLQALGVDPSKVRNAYDKSPVDYLREQAFHPEDESFGALRNTWDATWALYGYTLLGARVLPLSLAPAHATIKVGEKVPFQAWLETDSGPQEVTAVAVWASQDPSVTEVVYGLVTGLSPGSTVITAAYEGLTGSASVTVTAAGSGGQAGGSGTCRVGVAVVGRSGELIFGPGYVELSETGPWGLTALGALDATGLPYRLSEQYEGFVEEIADQANQGWSGWCYAVNDALPTVAAHQYRLTSGDRVVWYYSVDFSTPVPKWGELVKRQSAEASSAAEALSAVEEARSGLQAGRLTPAEAISRLEPALAGLSPERATAELKAALAATAKLLAEILAELPDKALITETKDEGATVSVKAGELKEYLTALQAAAGLGEKLKVLGVEEATALSPAELTVPVPPEVAGAARVSVLFPAQASQAISEANLALVLKHPDLTLTLSPRSLQILTDTRPEAAPVEIAVERVAVEGLALFPGARPLTSRAVAVNVRALVADGGQDEPESFPEDLTVALTCDEDEPNRESPDPSRLALYRRDEKGRWAFVDGELELQARVFRGRTSRLGLFLLAEYLPPFRDLEGHWAKEEVERLARRLVVRGVTADRFDPQGAVTRAQFVALMVRALGLPEEVAPAPVFGDLPEGHWARAAVEAAYRSGLVQGDGRGNFAPDRPLSREEMAVLLARALERYGRAEPASATPEPVLAPYRDREAVSVWAREAFVTAVTSGLLQGRSATELGPQDPSTRAEAAKVIGDLLRLLGRI